MLLDPLNLCFLDRHPAQAARVLETVANDELLAVFTAVAVQTRARLLLHLSSVHACYLLGKLQAPLIIDIFEHMPANTAAALLRRLPTALQTEVLKAPQSRERLQALHTLIQFPLNTAGAVLDPTPLYIQGNMKVREVKSILENYSAELHNEIPVVNESLILLGYVKTRDLLVVAESGHISEVLHNFPVTVNSHTHFESILEHPVWNELSVLAVVDAGGVLLGTLTRKTLLDSIKTINNIKHEADPPKEILFGLAETFLNTFSELLSENKTDKAKTR